MNYIEQGIKVGDKVWTKETGWDEVSGIGKNTPFPIHLKSGLEYTADGRFHLGKESPSLFWNDPRIVPPPKPEPPKYQWLWRYKGEKEWNLSTRLHESFEDFWRSACIAASGEIEYKRFIPPVEEDEEK